jgi:hypothetical protein
LAGHAFERDADDLAQLVACGGCALPDKVADMGKAAHANLVSPMVEGHMYVGHVAEVIAPHQFGHTQSTAICRQR